MGYQIEDDIAVALPKRKKNFATAEERRANKNATTKKWHENNRHGRINSEFLRAYGVPRSFKDEKLKEQGGCCAICKTTTPKGRFGWHQDHDHATNKVRGVLCNRCNLALGHFADCIPSLKAAIAYLESYNVA